MDKHTLRESPYSPGCYFVNGDEWHVGERYKLLKVLGAGSHGTVCLAYDNRLQEQVALKRIGNVLNSPEYAKCVLRELCILRRIGHIAEGIVRLKDVFLKPSGTGRLVMRKGQLVPLSQDIYLSMEYCEQGDLFAFHGQLMENEVRRIMWQLLSSIQQLHAMHVWHRDVKTGNLLIELRDGRRTAKLADFGSARPALDKLQTVEKRSASGNEVASLQVSTSMDDVSMSLMDVKDLYAAAAQEGGFHQSLTRVVCTPCYRAPEVVMLRGNYSSAMDIWSAGCVFGELLQRVPHIGASVTPRLQVAPVFALTGIPLTPGEEDVYSGGPGNVATRAELDALFNVIGTPCWASIQDVPSPSWRHYLYHIPGKAPTLQRRFGAAGEVAVDLLSRLLCFDPARRCSAEEALQHEYFGELAAERIGESRRAQADELRARVIAMTENTEVERATAAARDQALADLRCRQLEEQAGQANGLQDRHAARYDDDGGGLRGGIDVSSTDMMASPQVVHVYHDDPSTQSAVQPADQPVTAACVTGAAVIDGVSPAVSAVPAGQPAVPLVASTSEVAAVAAAGIGRTASGATGGTPFEEGAAPWAKAARHLHFWEISDPSLALLELEAELSTVCHDPGGVDKLREMLEREVSEHMAGREVEAATADTERQSRAARSATAPGSSRVSRHDTAPTSGTATPTNVVMRNYFSFTDTSSGWPVAAQPPTLDPSNQAMQMDADKMGFERIPHHADSAMATLDPDVHLRAGRHGEWASAALEVGPRAGSVWGVSLVPPGVEESSIDPAMMAIIRSQHAR